MHKVLPGDLQQRQPCSVSLACVTDLVSLATVLGDCTGHQETPALCLYMGGGGYTEGPLGKRLRYEAEEQSLLGECELLQMQP